MSWPTRPTREQFQQLHARLIPSVRQLNALVKRLDAIGCPPSEAIHRDALAAQAAVQALLMTVHYAGCASGVGRRADEA